MSQKARWSRRMSQMAHAHYQRSQGAMTTETLYARRGAQSITQTPQSAVLILVINGSCPSSLRVNTEGLPGDRHKNKKVQTRGIRSKYSNSPFYRRLRSYHRPHFDLSSTLPSPILSVNRDGKGEGERRWIGNNFWHISRGPSIKNCCCAMRSSSREI
jgi:hypothetical protein